MGLSILEQYAPRPVFEDVLNEKTGNLEQEVARYAITREHGIRATHVRNEEACSIDYIIEHQGHTKVIPIYQKKGLARLLDAHRTKLARVGSSEYTHANYFQGRLGEIVMHIIVREFLARLANTHTGFSFKPVRRQAGEIISKNERYTILAGRNGRIFTYRTSDFDRGTERSHRPLVLGEFDGLYKVEEWGCKGMVICEAKTAKVSICTRKRRGQKSLTHIEKVIDPVKALYPSHHVFYLLMATRGRLVSNRYNYLTEHMREKAEDLKAAGVTPIFMPYCEQAGDFERMGRFIQQEFAHLAGIDIPRMREVTVDLSKGRIDIGSFAGGMPLRVEYHSGGSWNLYEQDGEGKWYEMKRTRGGFVLNMTKPVE